MWFWMLRVRVPSITPPFFKTQFFTGFPHTNRGKHPTTNLERPTSNGAALFSISKGKCQFYYPGGEQRVTDGLPGNGLIYLNLAKNSHFDSPSVVEPNRNGERRIRLAEMVSTASRQNDHPAKRLCQVPPFKSFSNDSGAVIHHSCL